MDDKAKESTLEPVQEVTDKDFEVFYQQEDPKDLPDPLQCHLPPTHISTILEEANTPEGIVLEEKTPDLLALLIAHTRGASLVVSVVP